MITGIFLRACSLILAWILGFFVLWFFTNFYIGFGFAMIFPFVLRIMKKRVFRYIMPDSAEMIKNAGQTLYREYTKRK
jgi:hypothetical protein